MTALVYDSEHIFVTVMPSVDQPFQPLLTIGNDMYSCVAVIPIPKPIPIALYQY